MQIPRYIVDFSNFWTFGQIFTKFYGVFGYKATHMKRKWASKHTHVSGKKVCHILLETTPPLDGATP